MTQSGNVANAVIFGCAGPSLSDSERQFFRDAAPAGFILFARNIETPAQVRRLVAELRECSGGGAAFVLIDQEGGRVARLKPPHWREAPPAGRIGALYTYSPEAGVAAAWLNARLQAEELHALGIDVDCAPVLDLCVPGAHDIIGDRSFGADTAAISMLGRSACNGFMAGGVLPVVKHVPGHGRALQDSHMALPVVTVARDVLEDTDFAPFRALADMPAAMTAHVVYDAVDPDHPATTSAIVIRDVIRGAIGFDGLLISDDLSMKALQGGLGARAAAARRAGCDVVLHCNGAMPEMQAVAAESGRLSPDAERRITAARACLSARKDLPDNALEHFSELMSQLP
ncbi:MAG: beta-N-acetylhexosaminidase [Alphaproteobacteria bacterium]